jgi:peptidoglycan hydrolase CwlO-like protein
MMAASDVGSSPLLIATIAGLAGVFGGGTLVALFRVNADKNRVVIDASQGAVVVQSGVIKDLRGELTRMQEEVHNLRDKDAKKAKQLNSCADEIRALHNELNALRNQLGR